MEENMNHLLVFDIENVQEDYSNVLEYISLLQKYDFDGCSKILNRSLVNKFSRITLDDSVAPRYLECPKYERCNYDVDKIETSDIVNEYYDILNKCNVVTEKDIILESLSNLYCEDDLHRRVRAVVPTSICAKIFSRVKTSRLEMEESIKKKDVYYHIRVKVNVDEIYNLQYLALLLKKSHDLVKSKRISVILINEEVQLPYYPFFNPNDKELLSTLTESHKLFSQYLRLLAKDNTGVIYAPFYKEVQDRNRCVNVLPLDFTDAAVGDVFFPLLEIGIEEYAKLFSGSISMSCDDGNKLLPSIIREENLFSNDKGANKYALFNTSRNRFYNANSDNPKEAFLDYIAETAWRKLRKQWSENGVTIDYNEFSKYRKHIIKRFTKEENNWLTFAVFSFVFRRLDNVSVARCIDESYQMAREITNGLQQIIQNAIQHSEYHSCFFTFYLEEKNNSLKLFAVDINTQNTIVENFKGRLREEVESYDSFKQKELNNNTLDFDALINDHKLLMSNERLALRHFFNIFYCLEDEYENEQEKSVKKIWQKFRASDSTAHIGLLIFYQTLINCKADLVLQSSKEYFVNSNDILVDDEEKRNNREKIGNLDHSFQQSIKEKAVIPGTQYIISIPITSWNSNVPIGEASISNNFKFTEGYSAFANFIGYKAEVLRGLNEKIQNTIGSIENLIITKPKDKFYIQLVWTVFWSNYLFALSKLDIKNKVLCFYSSDIINKYLSKVDNAEVFLKGFFGAINIIKEYTPPVYFAMVNLEASFLEVLRIVFISLANRKFCKNIQLYFADASCESHLQILGETCYEGLCNSVHLAIEHGSKVFRIHDVINANHIASLSSDLLNRNAEKDVVKVMPFDVLIPTIQNGTDTIFDTQLHHKIKSSMHKPGAYGYKIEDTHMRLGNKVHISSFYEVSFLFYRTTIANRVAFKILSSYSNELTKNIHLQNDKKISVKPVLFYSYASYSKAILTSLVEITKEYIDNYINEMLEKNSKIDNVEILNDAKANMISYAKAQIGFASYQHNVQTNTNSEDIQLYFGLEQLYSGGELVKTENNGMMLSLSKDVDVIMVVPISSTLSTFDKMFEKLNNRVCKKSNNTFKLNLSSNYTVLWVCDEENFEFRKECVLLKPSKIEKNYWVEANIIERKIKVLVDDNDKLVGLNELKKCPYVYYFLCETAVWETPMDCRHCFPDDDKLILEVPLVETDLTSTVPSQQIRKEKEQNSKGFSVSKLDNDDIVAIHKNNSRLRKLQNCVYYGHIKRSKNHHQYYISTQDFFYGNGVREEIASWLEQLRKTDDNGMPVLKIIFSPEHNTNVGFAQYVNTYYFGGAAEIISINEDKVFRTNFTCEHEMLTKTIERLHIQLEANNSCLPVEFYFVDDGINTGVTIHKANSLLRSLIPLEYVPDYPTILFKKCFILIDRISSDSKSAYVASGDPSDFYSFAHIDISNMRVYGDSCVGCKLKNNTKRLFKRSASRKTASYWANKYERLKTVNYDDLNAMSKRKEEVCAYERLVLSHIAKNYIFKHGIATNKRGQYYDAILFIFEAIFKYSGSKNYRNYLKQNNFYFEDLLDSVLLPMDYRCNKNHARESIEKSKMKNAELLLKLLARPFFSFDFSFKLQMLSFVLILAECYLQNYTDNEQIIVLDKEKDSVDWITNIDILKRVIPSNDEYKSFLLKNNRLERTLEIAKEFMKFHYEEIDLLTSFLKDVLFEAIADMNSTYLLRKRVIYRVQTLVEREIGDARCKNNSNNNGEEKCKYLLDSSQCKNKRLSDCFWLSYTAHVQRIIDCSSDEVRAVWFNHLTLFGDEYDVRADIDKKANFYKSNKDLGLEELSKDNDPLATELFLTTASTEFDFVEKLADNTGDSSHFLKNYNSAYRWLNRNVGESTKQWYDLLPSSKKEDRNDDMDKRYDEFLKYLVKYIAETNHIKEEAINVALLTTSEKDKVTSIEKIQLVKEYFGRDTTAQSDVRRARYIIKDRVVSAIKDNGCVGNCIGVLHENGYQIVFPSNQNDLTQYLSDQDQIIYDNEHHVIGDHRKPYMVMLFDNPNEFRVNEDLGRKIAPFNCVYLYISLVIRDQQKLNKLPYIILRDILAYRNRIMRLLSKDFNGDIMGDHANNIQEEAILTHERSASHASTTDERGVLQVFGLGSVSELYKLQYPIDVGNKEILQKLNKDADQYNSAVLWLLLQNYVNCQIARLFSRHFNSNDEKLIATDGIPALYISAKDQQDSDVFKKCAMKFDDLQITPLCNNQDNRFKLMSHAAEITFCLDGSVRLRNYDCNGKVKYYNAEYLRCVLLDVAFSSLKYATVDDSLLPRVDNLINDKKREGASSVHCYMYFFRDKSDLVIINNVKYNRISENRIKEVNEEIYRRTHDALDYGDGHMSLFTIRSFILGINNGCSTKNEKGKDIDTSFKYIKKEELLFRYKLFCEKEEYNQVINKYAVWFETRLPIFTEEDINEQSVGLDR